MQKNKRFQYKISIIIFLVISTIFLLSYSLGTNNPNSLIKYFSYLYSTYTFIVIIFNIKRFYLYFKSKLFNAKVYKKIKAFLYKNKYLKKYFEDIRFKNIVNLCASAIINLTFIFLKFINGILNKSVWFISLSLYYFILTLTKIILLNSLKEYKKEIEYKVYCHIGWFIMVLNIALVIMIIQMVKSNVAIVYGGYVIYLTAIYTFYLIINAIRNVIKYRKYNSPILSSIKNINLLTACVSVLMLQTTMIATFDNNHLEYMRLMNSITGSIVSIITLTISIVMIIKGQKNINKQKEKL